MRFKRPRKSSGSGVTVLLYMNVNCVLWVPNKLRCNLGQLWSVIVMCSGGVSEVFAQLQCRRFVYFHVYIAFLDFVKSVQAIDFVNIADAN